MICKRPFLRAPKGVSMERYEADRMARIAMIPFGCGSCLPCRINRSREWKHRILLEQTSHQKSSFLTLTYNDEEMPKDDNCSGVLKKRDLQNFLKKLRQEVGIGIRYFAVGEYGSYYSRPHYHLALFGFGYENQKPIAKSWKKGFFQLGDLNPASAGYLTDYIIKDLWREKSSDELGDKPLEFMLSSKGTRKNKLGGLGRKAVQRIAESLLKQPYYEPKVIKEIRYGGKMMPLGRYLTRKLAEDQGISQEVIESELNKFTNELQLESVDSECTWAKHLHLKNKNKIECMEKRHEIFRQKRRLH